MDSADVVTGLIASAFDIPVTFHCFVPQFCLKSFNFYHNYKTLYLAYKAWPRHNIHILTVRSMSLCYIFLIQKAYEFERSRNDVESLGTL